MDTIFNKNKRYFFSRLLVLFIIASVTLLVVYNICFVYIRPNYFGIKKVNIGLKRGLLKKVYFTGLNFRLPFGFEEMYVFPRNIQVLDLSNRSPEYYPNKTHRGAVHIQTSDGFFVDLDVSVLYRIEDPYKVISKIGPGNLFILNGIVPKAAPVLKEALGVLTTEEFYNSHMRSEAVNQAEVLLQKELEPKGLKVEHILIRYFKYSREIQRNIEEKKLKDQLVFKNMAEAKAAAEEVKLKEAIEKGKASVLVKLEEGQAYVMKKSAEKEAYSRKKHAQANLLMKLAEAYKVQLKNEALSSLGADKRVGLEMAEVYKGINLIVLPATGPAAINPLDLDATIAMFGIKKNEKTH